MNKIKFNVDNKGSRQASLVYFPLNLNVNPKLNLQSGQLAVGLAFAFAGILAMFGLVFQSSLNTIDKAKLQTTSDYATLMASQNQAANLNEIQNINEKIQYAFGVTMSEIQPSFATLNQIAGAPEEITIGTAAGNLSSSTFGQVAPGSCAQMGKDADKWYRKKQIGFYTTVRNQAASAIVTIVTDSNELSFQRSLDYFLDPDGLPHGMFMKLKQTLGSSFTASDVKKEYEKGTLVNDEEFAYEILDENREDPLFIPQNEPRTFTYPQYIYQDVPCHETALGVPTDVCCVFGGPSPLPGATPANARVTKATDDVAYFMAGVRYTPPLSIIQKMLKIGVKNPDSDSANFGKDLDGTLSEEKLFRARAKHQRTMFQVFSAAKPYGGEYPESGNMMDSSGFSGTSGESFKGAKLFGIADVDEVGGVRVHRADGTIANRDYQGNINGEVPFYAEDFLH